MYYYSEASLFVDLGRGGGGGGVSMPCNAVIVIYIVLYIHTLFSFLFNNQVAELVDKIFLEIDETLQLQGQSSTNKSEILHNLLMVGKFL